jgi:two-component system OmpR family sensor kinase
MPGATRLRRALQPWSFRTHLTARWTATFGVLVTGALIAVYVSARACGYQLLDQHLLTIAATELAASTDGDAPIHLHRFPLQTLADAEFAPKFSRVYDAGGRTVLNSGEVDATIPLLDAGTVAAAFAGEIPVVDLEIDGRRARLVALRTAPDQEERYVIAVGTFTDLVDAALARLAWILAGVWLLAIGATAALGYRLASRALQPIERITERAAAIARDERPTTLDVPAVDDEIGRMTMRLNEMLGRLQQVIDTNRHFAADASHELRTPLTAIRGEIDVALSRDRPAGEYQGTLRRIRTQVDEMFTLTEGLMLLVRSQRRTRTDVAEVVPVASLVDESRRRLSHAAAERFVGLDVLQEPDLVVFGDARLLGRALDNVVANAIQHSPPGSRVRVSAACRQGGGQPEDRVVIEVADNGPGIPEAQWERVFDRFFRLDASRSRRTGGAGLGLAICRAILERFGGSVRVLASDANGTTFQLTMRGTRSAGLSGREPAPVALPMAMREPDAG